MPTARFTTTILSNVEATTPLELRSATRADVAAIAAMQKASLLETYEPFLGRAAVEEFIAEGQVERYFEEHWHQATVATSGGEIEGVAVLVGAVLDLIWVRPESRSQGIGAALLRAAESMAAVEGNVLTLEVWDVNQRAVAFYERSGFSVIATTEDRETGLDKLLMRKKLPRSARVHIKR
jgi:ribosomal protein S18 acetylase RimI-like enzyme